MDYQEDFKNKLIEYLWTEINIAILKSKEVKNTVNVLEDMGLLDLAKEYDLVLDMKKLIQLIDREKSRENEDSSETGLSESQPEIKIKKDPVIPAPELKKESPKNPPLLDFKNPKPTEKAEEKPSAQFVDGKCLTENEILFLKYMEENFDQKSWLKRGRIQFEEES